MTVTPSEQGETGDPITTLSAASRIVQRTAMSVRSPSCTDDETESKLALIFAVYTQSTHTLI